MKSCATNFGILRELKDKNTVSGEILQHLLLNDSRTQSTMAQLQ
jgi:hypothetical protein